MASQKPAEGRNLKGLVPLTTAKPNVADDVAHSGKPREGAAESVRTDFLEVGRWNRSVARVQGPGGSVEATRRYLMTLSD